MKNFLSKFIKKNLNSSISINGDVITGISPLKKSGSFLSSGNNVSFCGYINSNKVKIYQACNQDSLKLRLTINSFFKTENKCFSFPKVISVFNDYIIEEWIDGHSLDNQEIHKKLVTDFLNLSSTINYKSDFFINYNGFSYFDNFLLNRLDQMNFISNIPKIRDDWFNYRQNHHKCHKMISHNDLTQSNIIKRNENYYIIDNEFLTYGDCHVLNYYNSRAVSFNSINRFVNKTIHVREICSNYFRNSFTKMVNYIDTYPYD